MCPEFPYQIGERHSGFLIERVEFVHELGVTALLARHERSSLALLKIANEDPENLLGICFRTLPIDDTGAAHIIEHVVLGGSRNYPVDDPFVEMLKGSMATFLNAFTCSDRTVYPVASNVRQDFFNLAEVYLDAVFHPLLRRVTFGQEGYHLGIGEDGGTLRHSGVVYNEMKGAFSEFETQVVRDISRSLFPESPYRFDSGGDPRSIPTLDYSGFVEQYRQWYRPDNACVFAYGDLPADELFAFLDARIPPLEAPPRRCFSVPALQERWSQPRFEKKAVVLGKGEDPRDRSAVTVNWLVGNVFNMRESLSLNLLDRLLLGDAGAPLAKILVESGLGDDLLVSGFEDDNFETTFHIGLRGCQAESARAFEDLVLSSLAQIAREGFSPSRIEAAFQQFEYSIREIDSQYPVTLMDSVLGLWVHGGDPLTALRILPVFSEVRACFQKDKQFFTDLIERHLLQNPHRLTLAFEPSVAEGERLLVEEKKGLMEYRQGMSDEEFERFRGECENFSGAGKAPEDAVALSTIPRLHLEDLPRSPQSISTEITEFPGGSLLVNDVFTNGLNYVLMAFELGGLDPELVEMVPLFAFLFGKIGTKGLGYAAVAERISGVTDGISGTALFSHHASSGELVACFSLSFCSLDKTLSPALALLDDLLGQPDFSDDARLRDLLSQRQAQLTASILSHGNGVASSRASCGFSSATNLNYCWGGLNQLRLVRQYRGGKKPALERMREKLVRLSRFIAGQARCTFSFAGSDGKAFEAKRWLAGRGFVPVQQFRYPHLEDEYSRYGIEVAGESGFCAHAYSSFILGNPKLPLLQVGAQLLMYTHLWKEIRSGIGAYGAYCVCDAGQGVFACQSYRDPNPLASLSVFRDLPAFVAAQEWTHDEVERAVLASAKEEEYPLRPSLANRLSLGRFLSGVDDGFRLAARETMLTASPKSLQCALLDVVGNEDGKVGSCVLAPSAMLSSLSLKEGWKIERSQS